MFLIFKNVFVTECVCARILYPPEVIRMMEVFSTVGHRFKFDLFFVNSNKTLTRAQCLNGSAVCIFGV